MKFLTKLKWLEEDYYIHISVKLLIIYSNTEKNANFNVSIYMSLETLLPYQRIYMGDANHDKKHTLCRDLIRRMGSKKGVWNIFSEKKCPFLP